MINSGEPAWLHEESELQEKSSGFFSGHALHCMIENVSWKYFPAYNYIRVDGIATWSQKTKPCPRRKLDQSSILELRCKIPDFLETLQKGSPILKKLRASSLWQTRIAIRPAIYRNLLRVSSTFGKKCQENCFGRSHENCQKNISESILKSEPASTSQTCPSKKMRPANVQNGGSPVWGLGQ